MQKIIDKAQTTFVVVRCTCGKKWGLRPNMVHWLYTRVIRPSIFHGSLMWWSKAMQKTTKIQLGRIQRMACLAITGAMKSTPTAAMEILLNLTPLDLVIQAEARMALYRLHILKQPADPKVDAGLLSIWKNVTLFWKCGRTILLQFIIIPKPSVSLQTGTIGKIKTQCSLRML